MAFSLKKQQWVYLGIILVLLSVILSSIYYLLGGFEEVKVYQLEGGKRNIIGKYFKGYYAHPDLKEIWFSSREMLEKGAIQGDLALVNYANDSLESDEVEQFIGVALTGGMAEIPAGFEVMEVSMDRKLAIFLSMHPLVRPRPQSVETMLQSYAASESLVLGNYTLELHYADNSMAVEAPIIEQESF